MAKKSDRLRDEEREVETEAAYAGEGAESEDGDEQYMIPSLEKIDDIARIESAAKEAEGPGGASGPGINGGSETELY